MHRDRPTALHRSVYDELAARLADGRLPRGGRLPPERTLCQELNVSRATLRKALAALAADGVIHAVQGRGTYASPPQLAEPPNTLLSFSRLAAGKGLTATSRVITAVARPATISESEHFRVAPGSAMFELERLRMLDGLPVALGRSLVPLAHAPAVAEQDWSSASLYEVLAAAGCAPTRASYTIEAQAADAYSSKLLAVPSGAPVLLTESTGFSVDGRCVEQSRMVYRGDRYRFQSMLTAPPPTAGVSVSTASWPWSQAPALEERESPHRILAPVE